MTCLTHSYKCLAVKKWLEKPRWNITKVPSRDVQQPVQLQDADVQVDTQSEEIERVWRVAEALDGGFPRCRTGT